MLNHRTSAMRLNGRVESEGRERPHAALWAALKDTRVLDLGSDSVRLTLGSYRHRHWLR